MQLRKIKINQLKPAPYNPRVPLRPGTPGYRRLERSLREFSLVQPIVWNEQTGHVVSGHQRLEVLKDQGVEEVDVVVVSLPLEREKALNITLNNAQVGSDWDAGKLLDVVAELNALPDFDATLTGFDPADLRDLLLAPEPQAEENAALPGEANIMVRVTLEIPHEDWEYVRPDLDELIARHELTAHVRMPA